MYLYGRRIRGASIPHPLGKLPGLPREIDATRLAELTERLRAGDWGAVDEIVTGCMRLAISIASQYAAHAIEKANDLVSEATLGIVEGCHLASIGEMEGDDLKKFLVAKIHGRLTAFLRRDHLVKVPYSTNRDSGFAVPVPKIHGIVHAAGAAGRPWHVPLDTIELLEMSATTDQERAVVAMRAAEMVDREIADALHISLGRVAQIRDGIISRYQELEKL